MPDESSPPEPAEEEGFKIWTAAQSRPGQLGLTGATLKVGPLKCKTVNFGLYGDQDTGEVSKRELRFKTFPRRTGGESGYDFDAPEVQWACENEEIERLLAFLGEDVSEPGRYRVIRTNSSAAQLLDLLRAEGLDPAQAAEQLGAALAASPEGVSVAESAIIMQRREIVTRVRELVADPSTTEPDIQREIGDAWWFYAGRYVGVAPRNLFPMDQHDIPLVALDRSLHIVELKQANIPDLVHRHRNHYIVGEDVHDAVSQAINYVRAADELGASLQTAYANDNRVEIDLRRAAATVVIGHPDHVSDADVTAELVDQTIRTYNAHLSRVQVVTYQGLLEAADRALIFEAV